MANGIVVIDHVFVSADEAAFLLAQWKLSLWKLQTGSAPNASKIVDLLRSVKLTGNAVLKRQVVELTRTGIYSSGSNRHNRATRMIGFELYHLTPAERALIAVV